MELATFIGGIVLGYLIVWGFLVAVAWWWKVSHDIASWVVDRLK